MRVKGRAHRPRHRELQHLSYTTSTIKIYLIIMATALYTKFPFLLSENINEDRLQASTHQFNDLQGSEEDLFRAWASILNGYIGHDDQVTFFSDEGFVEVDLKDGGITKHEKVHTQTTTRDATAIYLRSVRSAVLWVVKY